MEPTQRRTRGRPREVVRRTPGRGMPLGHRSTDDPPTARAILDAAHRVLLRGGTKGLTLVAVAREAHVDVTTVSYHFGTRHGLIEALMDRLYADPSADFAEAAARLPGPAERWHAYLSEVLRMSADREAARVYFEIATLALREPALATRLAGLNRETIRAFGAAMGEVPELAGRPIGELVHAAVDGIALHHAIAGDGYPIAEVLSLLEEIVLSAGTDSSR